MQRLAHDESVSALPGSRNKRGFGFRVVVFPAIGALIILNRAL